MGSVLQLVPNLIGQSTAFQNDYDTARLNVDELARSQRLETANAVAARREGALGVGLMRSRGTATAAAARAAFASNNVDASSGTAAQMQQASADTAELDASTIRANALAAALGHQETARKYGIEEQRLRTKYDIGGSQLLSQAEGDSYLRMSSSILGAAGDMFGGK